MNTTLLRVNKELIIRSNSSAVDFALLKDGKLIELNKEIEDNKFSVGDIFFAKVRKSVGGLNAAFVNVGHEKDGFLHYQDLGPKLPTLLKFIKQVSTGKTKDYLLKNFRFEEDIEKNGVISDAISSNQQILVQVVKEPISTKGPRISSELSLAGRYMVLVPFSSTGSPKKISYSKQAMVYSAVATGDHFGLKIGDRALHCLSADFIAGKMMLVRAMILGLEIDILPPNGNVLDGNSTLYDFAAMVPLQAENSLNSINQIKTLIIGGAAPSESLLESLKTKKTKSFVTYGMTETLTHIASRSIFSNDSSYHVLPGVTISKDDRSCLNIEVPYIQTEPIVTNDIVELKTANSFLLLGRNDTVINSGGIKIIPEAIERKISALLSVPYFIGGIPDEKLGQQSVLVVEQKKPIIGIIDLIRESGVLTDYEIPKKIYQLESFEYTDNGKLKRKETLSKLEELPY